MCLYHTIHIIINDFMKGNFYDHYLVMLVRKTTVVLNAFLITINVCQYFMLHDAYNHLMI